VDSAISANGATELDPVGSNVPSGGTLVETIAGGVGNFPDSASGLR
jgi:hypothetical protein